MNKLIIVLLIISLLINVAAIFVAFKAINYRKSLNTANDHLSSIFRKYSSRDTHLESNQKLTDNEAHDKRVVFMGASITEAWDLEKTFPDIEPINRGIYGNKVGGYLLRFRSDVLNLKPKAVVIKICSINFRPAGTVPFDEIRDYVISMVDLARAHQVEPVLATTVPIRKDGERYGSYSVTENVKLYNSWLKGYADIEGLKLIDYFSAMADQSGYMPENITTDHIHPNQAGYDLMANAVKPVLAEIMS